MCFSYHRLQVWLHDFAHPAYIPILHQFFCIESPLFLIEFEGFQDDIEPQFVAEFKTIGNCLFRAIDENFHPIDSVFFDAGIVGFLGHRAYLTPGSDSGALRSHNPTLFVRAFFQSVSQ